MTTVLRACIAHTPRDPFTEADALETYADGGLAFSSGRILAVGEFAGVRAEHPESDVLDARDAIVLPGLVDCHVHFPQIGVIGAMGLELMHWLQTRTLPEEASLADPERAVAAAERFVDLLARNGTTTALVFGSHSPAAQEALFRAAERSRLRISTGLALSDRHLRPELETTAELAFRHSAQLIERWHGRGRLRYAVTPRFSVSCSEAMLETCTALQRQADGLLFTSHLNEHPSEIAIVHRLFPWASDYLETYERFGLVHERAVLAHDVHPTADELRRLAAAGAWIAHCPSSNAFLGSGAFPLRRHLEHGARFALGSDVGAGTGLSLLNEGLAAYQTQMAGPDGYRLGAAHLLFLATRAGALALGCAEETGDLSPGKSADFVLVRAPRGSTLEAALGAQSDLEDALGVLFTLAREESIAEVRVAGEIVAGGLAPG